MLHCPTPSDTTSFYRGVGPYAHLERENSDIVVYQATPDMLNDWTYLSAADVLILQRPFRQDHVYAAQMAKELGLKVIVDYDDYLFEVPIENRSYLLYSKQETQTHMRNCITLADKVTVTTKELAVIDDTKCVVIENGFDERWMRKYKKTEMRLSSNFCWRGTDTHSRDILTVKSEILDIYNTHKDISFFFYGYFPADILEHMDQKRFRSLSLPKAEFINSLSKTDSSIGWIPLVNNKFNRSKSNIGWIELTHSGHVVLAQDLDEFKRPGVVTYSDAKDFRDKSELLIKDSGYRKKKWEESKDYLWSNLTLQRINQKRYDLIRGLVDT